MLYSAERQKYLPKTLTGEKSSTSFNRALFPQFTDPRMNEAQHSS